MRPSPGPVARRLAEGAIAVSIVVASAATGWVYLQDTERRVVSEDASLEAAAVHVASSVPERIISFGVSENGRVRQGDLLFAIDPTPYRLSVDQARAELEAAEAALADQGRAIRAEEANVAIAEEQVTRARANLALAEQTLERFEPIPVRPGTAEVRGLRAIQEEAKSLLPRVFLTSDNEGALSESLASISRRIEGASGSIDNVLLADREENEMPKTDRLNDSMGDILESMRQLNPAGIR